MQLINSSLFYVITRTCDLQLKLLNVSIGELKRIKTLQGGHLIFLLEMSRKWLIMVGHKCVDDR